MSGLQRSGQHERPEDMGAVAGHGIVLTGSALVPLGIVVTVVVSILGAAWWIGTGLYAAERRVNERLIAIEHRLDDLDDKIDLATSSRFSLLDAKFWASQFAAMNKTVKVPEPTHYPLPGEPTPKP